MQWGPTFTVLDGSFHVLVFTKVNEGSSCVTLSSEVENILIEHVLCVYIRFQGFY